MWILIASKTNGLRMSRQRAEKLQSGGHTPYNSKMHLNPGATYDGFFCQCFSRDRLHKRDRLHL